MRQCHLRMSLIKRSNWLILPNLSPWVHVFLIFCVMVREVHVGWLLECDTRLEEKHLEACLSCRWARLSVHGTPLLRERTPTNDGYSESGIWQKWTGWVHPFHGKRLTANDNVWAIKRKIRILENLHQPLWSLTASQNCHKIIKICDMRYDASICHFSVQWNKMHPHLEEQYVIQCVPNDEYLMFYKIRPKSKIHSQCKTVQWIIM